MVANRTSGVAPLAVFFDATGTTAASVTSQPFHDLLYGWNFGDSGPSAGAWGQGTRAGVANGRNSATGALTAHTFETPGSYPVTLTVSDGKGNVASSSCTIVVNDPNTVYSGANTTCISVNTDFTGCPSGAAQVPNYSGSVTGAISSYLSGGNKRLLFHAGQTFTQGYNGSGASMNVANSIIGAFPIGSAANIQYSYSGTSVDAAISLGGGASNVTVMDLAITGSGGSSASAISTEGYQPTKVLYLRVTGSTFGGHVLSIFGADESIVQDSSVGSFSGAASNSGHGIILGTSHTGAINKYQAALGNNVNCAGSQVAYCLRSELARYTVVSNNTLTEGPGTSFGTIKISGWVDSNHVTSADDGRYIYIADNVNTASAAAYGLLGAGPNTAGQDSRLQDYIIEGNYFNGMPGGGGGGNVMVNVAAPYGTIRSNVFRASDGSTGGGYPIRVFFTGVPGTTPPTDHVYIYNNTLYDADAELSGQLQAIRLENSTSAITVKNNLFYFPNAVSPYTINNVNSGSVTQSNNTCGNGTSTSCSGTVTTDPQFTNGSGLLQLFTDYGIRSGSFAISAGTGVPVWLDAVGVAWPPAWDLGAIHR